MEENAKEKESGDSAKVLGALVLGVAVGAALGMLFAPAKGSETRENFLNFVSGMADELKARARGGEAKDPEGDRPV